MVRCSPAVVHTSPQASACSRGGCFAARCRQGSHSPDKVFSPRIVFVFTQLQSVWRWILLGQIVCCAPSAPLTYHNCGLCLPTGQSGGGGGQTVSHPPIKSIGRWASGSGRLYLYLSTPLDTATTLSAMYKTLRLALHRIWCLFCLTAGVSWLCLVPRLWYVAAPFMMLICATLGDIEDPGHERGIGRVIRRKKQEEEKRRAKKKVLGTGEVATEDSAQYHQGYRVSVSYPVLVPPLLVLYGGGGGGVTLAYYLFLVLSFLYCTRAI